MLRSQLPSWVSVDWHDSTLCWHPPGVGSTSFSHFQIPRTCTLLLSCWDPALFFLGFHQAHTDLLVPPSSSGQLLIRRWSLRIIPPTCPRDCRRSQAGGPPVHLRCIGRVGGCFRLNGTGSAMLPWLRALPWLWRAPG